MNDEFYNQILQILTDARSRVFHNVNFTMVEAYWHVGKMIVEEQGGVERNEYGKKLLQELAVNLTRDFGKGFTVTNLKYMRQFYLTFPNISELSRDLSWSHYRLLIQVDSENARQFYTTEAIKSRWSVRQLARQIDTFFYERLLSSQDKKGVAAEIQKLEPGKTPSDVIRDPYVLEFLGLSPNDDFYESDLEQALITHLQKFLLELGRGFSFVARQKRFTFDGRHFRIDLVFYNYILKCFVLIDLKVGDLTHQDLGQMQMYVHYYERELMNPGDNPPIGIVLCANKSDSLVQYTLSENENQIFASKYKLYLPTEEELLRELKMEYDTLENSAKPKGLLTESITENDTKETQNDTKKIKTLKEVLAKLRENPAITTVELIRSLKLGRATILRYLKQLQIDGIIERVGSRKYGTWKIVRDL